MAEPRGAGRSGGLLFLIVALFVAFLVFRAAVGAVVGFVKFAIFAAIVAVIVGLAMNVLRRR